LIAGTILTPIVLLFDLVTRADILSQYLWISDYTNVTTGYFYKEDALQDLNDPVIMIYHKNKMSIVMTYLLLIRGLLGFTLSWSIMLYSHPTMIFRIIWWNQAMYLGLWMTIIRLRTSIRYKRARELHKR
jgi:hypothetical protein